MKPIRFFFVCMFFCVHAMGQAPALSFDPISVSTIASRDQFELPLLGPVDAAGNIYYVITNTICRRNTNGTVTVIAGTAGIGGYVDGPGITAQFSGIEDLDMDAGGNIYVADAGNKRIRKITPAGMVSTLAGDGIPGYQDGNGTGARFAGPGSMAMDAAGNIYVLDNYSIRKITLAGVVTTVFGNGSPQSELNSATDLVMDAAGNFFVNNIYGDLLKITPAGVISNNLPAGYFGFKTGLTIDKAGNLYVAFFNPSILNSFIIYKNSPGGELAPLAGSTGGYKDSIGLSAQFNFIQNLSVDGKDNIYVSDQGGIRKISKPVLIFTGNAGVPSPAQYFNISANYLAGPASLQAPGGYELSFNQSGPYAADLSVPSIGGEILVRRIYLRLRAGNTAGVYNDSVVLSAGGAITQRLGISGTVTNSPKKLVIIGSGTSACISLHPVTECYVGRLSTAYNKLAPFDTTIDNHLARGSTNCYNGMPSSYISPYPAGSVYRPLTDINITAALALNPDAVLVNYPTNGYDELSINEIMFCLRTIRDSASKKGVPCFITTTQPRVSPSSFNTPATKLKLAILKDSILAAFGSYAIDFYTGLINPADSSVLYDLGDHINMNAAGHSILYQRVQAKNIFGAVSSVGSGTGLQGTYFNNRIMLSPSVLSRVDPVINNEFAGTSPAPGVVNVTDYSVRWTGQVEPLFSEIYTFYALADDAVRLWVNGVQLIDNWTIPLAGEKSGTIALVAGQRYDIVMEYYQIAGNAVSKLFWSSARSPKAIIPSAQLYPVNPLPPSLPACAINNAPVNGTTIATINSALLIWAPDAAASAYSVFIWAAGATAPAVPSATVSSSSYQVTGLSPSTLYYWYVLPYNSVFVATGCGTTNKSSFTTAAASQSGSGTGLRAVYFNGTALSGTPLLTRTDTTINFEFTYSKQPQVFSPAPGIVPVDFYSVRWTGQVQALYSETYTFYTVSDDGVRLWVNGELLIDNWVNQGATEKSGFINLAAGQKYDIKIEYYENTGESVTKLYWSSESTAKAIVPKLQLFPAGAVVSPFPACATNLLPLSGSTIATQTTTILNWTPVTDATSYDVYLWTGSTAPASPVANATTATYNVTGLSAATLYSWYVAPRNANGAATGCISSKTSFTTAAASTTGNGTGLQGAYYNGIALSGTPLLARIDPIINFEMTYYQQPQVFSPAPGIVPEDHYSVRWTGQVEALYSETYTFYTVADDGIRLWVNGVQLVNNWVNQGATERSGSITLVAGQKYDIVIEYYENTGESVAKLYWSSASTAKAIVPKLQLYPPAGNLARIMDNTLRFANSGSVPWGVTAVSFVAGIYPNPVKSGQPARLQITSSKTGTAMITVISSNGHRIINRSLGLVAGINTASINTTGLAQGLYLVNVTGGDKPVTLKLIVE